MNEPRHVAVARLSGDICTKAKQTRRAFHRRLKSNLKDALNRAKVDYSFKLREARFDIDIEGEGDAQKICEYASRVFGIHSVTAGRAYAWDTLDDIVRIGVDEFADAVADRKFAVRARRSGRTEDVPFKSPDVERELGAALLDLSAGVDLDDPEFTARVDVRSDGVVFYEEPVAGPRGLPIGVEGRALALVSGGFDSSVAAWKMLSRGIDLDFVFFNLGGPPHEQGVVDVLRTFVDRWCYGYRPELHVVDFRPLVGEMKAKTRGRYWQVLLKRYMLRAASAIAQAEDHRALVTGDALGQVSSQTLYNLAAVSAACETVVLRPLVGYDKDDIVNLSRVVGTHDLSATTPEYCALDAEKPATRCSARELIDVESALDPTLVGELVAQRTTERVDRLEDPVQHDVRVDAIPDGAVVLDLREDEERGWTYPDAVHFPFDRALRGGTMLPRQGNYVLFCDVGLKSAFLAERLREEGWDASSFAGGVPALKRWAKRQQKTA